MASPATAGFDSQVTNFRTPCELFGPDNLRRAVCGGALFACSLVRQRSTSFARPPVRFLRSAESDSVTVGSQRDPHDRAGETRRGPVTSDVSGFTDAAAHPSTERATIIASLIARMAAFTSHRGPRG